VINATGPIIPEISVEEAARLATTDEVLLLDVRELDEWQAGHSSRATHLPLSQINADSVPIDRPIIVVCRSGNRSGRATLALVAAGIDATNMVGGMIAWAAAGLPMIDNDGLPGRIG